jgi:dienelactone hydrolase
LVVNFAGGRGGHAYGRPHAVCGPDRLIESASAYGSRAKVPTLWIYAANDSYFGPDLAAALASVWNEKGGRAELHLLPAYGSDGHDVVADAAGWDLWGRRLENFLAEVTANPRQHMVGK